MPQPSTQNFVDIAGIKDGIIMLKNGSYRVILSVSAVNFSLKSEEEQNSLVFQYQSFLNSLHFPIEIVMRSQRLNLTSYLNKIKKIKEKQTNELIKLQAEDYVDFVKQLIKIANIMKKNFFVVVPFDPISVKGESLLDKIFSKSSSGKIKISEVEFKRGKDELLERANVVASGLGGIGLRCVQLNTEQIIELFYSVYNPEMAEKEQLSSSEELTSPIVSKATKPNTNEEKGQEPDSGNEEVIDNADLVEDSQKKEMRQKKYEERKTPNQNTPPEQTNPENNNDQSSDAKPKIQNMAQNVKVSQANPSTSENPGQQQ